MQYFFVFTLKLWDLISPAEGKAPQIFLIFFRPQSKVRQKRFGK